MKPVEEVEPCELGEREMLKPQRNKVDVYKKVYISSRLRNPKEGGENNQRRDLMNRGFAPGAGNLSGFDQKILGVNLAIMDFLVRSPR